MYSNAQILAAVVNHWAQPLVKSLIGSYVGNIPALQMVENKIRSMGWVSPKWTLVGELSPIMESVTGNMFAPMMSKYLAAFDDATLPAMAHNIIDDAIKNGGLSLFEGKVVFEKSDLEELKRLLTLNLPYDKDDDIIINT